MRAIDADEVMEHVWRDRLDSRELFARMIKNAPTIEPKSKTGRWIQFPNHYAYKCSECGRVIETTDGKNNVCKHYPYCHCGCKMGVENE